MPARRSWSSISATRDMTLHSIELIKVADLGLRDEPLSHQRAVGDAAAEVRYADVENHDLMAREFVVDPRADRHVVGRLPSVRRASRPNLRCSHAVIVVDILAAQPFDAGMRLERKVAVVKGLAEIEAGHFAFVPTQQ